MLKKSNNERNRKNNFPQSPGYFQANDKSSFNSIESFHSLPLLIRHDSSKIPYEFSTISLMKLNHFLFDRPFFETSLSK